MGDPGKLSVILLVHNNIGMTHRCLKALSDAVADVDHEVILLDNGSKEDAAYLRGCGSSFRRFVFIRSNENTPFSIGNNRCVLQSSGRRLLFLNNDVFVARDSVRRLIAALDEDASIGATGGKLLFPGETAVQHAGIAQMLWEHPSNYGVGASPSDRRIQERVERFALSGAMLCVRRDVFEKAGGFDTRYVWGTEDIDLCLKIRAAGYRVIYCPDAVAVHCESATLKTHNYRNIESNCTVYRQTWNSVLVPAERKYVRQLKEQGIRRVAVFGTGTAAASLAKILDGNDIQIECFTSSGILETGKIFMGRPVVPLDLLAEKKYDRLMVASQYFFEIEPKIRDYDPLHEPIYPLMKDLVPCRGDRGALIA
jgi:GT2 family glycosyltransferase